MTEKLGDFMDRLHDSTTLDIYFDLAGEPTPRKRVPSPLGSRPKSDGLKTNDYLRGLTVEGRRRFSIPGRITGWDVYVRGRFDERRFHEAQRATGR